MPTDISVPCIWFVASRSAEMSQRRRLMSDADRRYEHLRAAHLDLLNTSLTLAHIDIPPRDERLRSRIAAALEAVHGVEDALLEAIRRDPPQTRQRERRAANDGDVPPRRGGFAGGERL
jgi:hypothetical protein